MLVNQINGKNFRNKLYLNIVISVLIVILGIVSMIFSTSIIMKIDGDHAVDFTRGFYGGLGGGLIGAGLVTIIKNAMLLKNEEKFKIEETKYNDERNRFISSKTWSISGIIMLFVIYIALVVSGIFNTIVFITLLAVLGVFGLVLLISKIVLDRVY